MLSSKIHPTLALPLQRGGNKISSFPPLQGGIKGGKSDLCLDDKKLEVVQSAASNLYLWLTIPKDRRATLDKSVTIAIMQIQGKYRD